MNTSLTLSHISLQNVQLMVTIPGLPADSQTLKIRLLPGRSLTSETNRHLRYDSCLVGHLLLRLTDT